MSTVESSAFKIKCARFDIVGKFSICKINKTGSMIDYCEMPGVMRRGFEVPSHVVTQCWSIIKTTLKPRQLDFLKSI